MLQVERLIASKTIRTRSAAPSPAAFAPRENASENRCNLGNGVGIVGDWDGNGGVFTAGLAPFKNALTFRVPRAMRLVLRMRIFGYTLGDFGLPAAGLAPTLICFFAS